MSYKDSFVYSLRQKVGDMRLITATVDVIPMNERGEIKLVYVKDIGKWSTAGGHVELGDSWQSAALNELYEEAGIVARVEDLELIAMASGPGRICEYSDGSTQTFTLCFLCRHWEKELAFTDTDEIVKTAWMKIEDINDDMMNKLTAPWVRVLKKYLETGKVQTIIEE